MFSKIEITGVIELQTGMHIGASEGFAAIGAIDSPVAKDVLTKMPYIPGSSLKGKMRSLLAKTYNEVVVKDRNEDHERIRRLFGASSKGDIRPSRLIFSDSILNNNKELVDQGVESVLEAKEENSINPLTAEANPRQIERVIRGAKFPLTLIYNVDNEEDLLEDMETISKGFELLRNDYIGGHGSRGYGRIKIYDLMVDCIVGDIDESTMKKCAEILGDK